MRKAVSAPAWSRGPAGEIRVSHPVGGAIIMGSIAAAPIAVWAINAALDWKYGL